MGDTFVLENRPNTLLLIKIEEKCRILTTDRKMCFQHSHLKLNNFQNGIHAVKIRGENESKFITGGKSVPPHQ